MWVVAGIVVDIDAGEGPFTSDNFDHAAHQTGDRAVGARCPGPCPIVVFLLWQRPHVGLRGFNVADEEQQRAV